VATDKVYVGELIMKKFKMIASALASTVAMASPVFAEWTKAATGTMIGVNSGDTYYIDFDTVKENNGYVYFWRLSDYLKPTKFGDLSAKVLSEVDCDIPRKVRGLSYAYYTQPMASGSTSATDNTAGEWLYPEPNSVNEIMINGVCDYAGK
jgi:hypothetical protein